MISFHHSLRIAQIAAAIAAIGLSATTGRASIYFFSGTGGSAGLSATAEFMFDATLDKVTVILTNTTASTYDAGDLLTGVRFSVGGLTPTVDSATGFTRSVNGSGVFTDSGSAASLTWSIDPTRTVGIIHELDFNPDAKHAIIGPPTAGSYSGATGSIQSNNGHDPFVALTATFVLDVDGLLDTTPFTLDSFLFGTEREIATGDISIPEDPTPSSLDAPEPASLAVWAIGGGVIGLCWHRRRAR
jgi:hypothetical protein